MAKYRKRPIIVEAEQWFPGKAVDGVYYEGSRPSISTLEGVFIVTVGDWIITGIEGERYPCKPSVFETTYELVEKML